MVNHKKFSEIYRAMAKSAKNQIEQDENKLLDELTKNSKENIDTMAKNCGFSRQKAWRMVKKLEKDQKIWGYTAIVDEEKKGLNKFMILIKRSTQPLEQKTADTIANGQLDSVYAKLGIAIESSYYLHGDYDWAIIFTAQDLRNAKRLSNILVENYPGVIEKMSLLRVLFSQREHRIFNPNPTKLREFL